jgi:protease IV
LATRRGLPILIVLLAVLGAGVFSLVLLVRRPASTPHVATVLVFRVPTELEEAQPPPSGFSLTAFRAERPTLWDVVRTIDRAAEDDHIEAMVLHIGELDWGWAKVAEVRDALGRFRAAGKKVYASFEGGEEKEFLLASAATRIAVAPLSTVGLDGLTASAMYLKGTFDKLDIHPNFAHVGQYKSAVEGYTRSDMSEPARAALQSLLDDEFRQLVDTLGAARGIGADSVTRLLDLGPFEADAAVTAGLADTVLYPEQVDSLAARAGGRRRATLRFERYIEDPDAMGTGPRIALVTAAGTIASGRSRESPMDGVVVGSETLIRALREAEDRSAIKAIVLRIDSPGGSAQASDEVWHEIQRARRRKPVIVSMSDLAASGGYYMACGADSIVAQPGTITGSIGVFGGKFNVLGLYRKLGLNVVTLSRGRNAEMLSPFSDFTPEQQQRFQSQMEGVYRTFVSRVSAGRGLGATLVDSIGQGRVWSGEQGRAIGLVDALGGLPRAMDMARSRARIPRDESVRIEVYPRPERTFWRWFFSGLARDDDDDATQIVSLAFPPVMRAWLASAQFPIGEPLALMPWSIEIR